MSAIPTAAPPSAGPTLGISSGATKSSGTTPAARPQQTRLITRAGPEESEDKKTIVPANTIAGAKTGRRRPNRSDQVGSNRAPVTNAHSSSEINNPARSGLKPRS